MATMRFRSCSNHKPSGTVSAAGAAMRTAIVVVCVLIGIACDEASPAGPTVNFNERFTLAPGEIATVKDADLRVQFVEVTGDSRCPGDAVCIQGGDALVHIQVISGGSTSSYVLHTGDSSRAAVVHGSVRITLGELQPYPFSSRPPITPGDYRATFTVAHT